MTTNYHTAISAGAAANAATFNGPLGQLDAAIDTAIAAGIADLEDIATEVENARDGYPNLLDHLNAMELEGAGTSTGLPLTAGSGNPLTGTLYFDPGSDDSNQLFRVPVTSENNGDILFNVGLAEFSGVEDVVFNLGFNNPVGGGQVDAGLHSWYMQMENDYRFSDKNWVEFHLNLYPVGGTGFRPMQFQYTTDGDEGYLSFRVTNLTVTNLEGTGSAMAITYDAPDSTTPAFRFNNVSEFWISEASGVAGFVVKTAAKTFYQVLGLSDSQAWYGAGLSFYNMSGTLKFQVDNAASSGNGINRSNTRLQVIASEAGYAVLNVRGAAAHSATLFQCEDSASSIQFAVGATGQIRTNQTAANTATPSGATAYQLPIYNAAGTLLGYIPVYGSAWS